MGKKSRRSIDPATVIQNVKTDIESDSRGLVRSKYQTFLRRLGIKRLTSQKLDIVARLLSEAGIQVTPNTKDDWTLETLPKSCTLTFRLAESQNTRPPADPAEQEKATQPKESGPKERSATTTKTARPSPLEVARAGGIHKTPDVTHRKSPSYTEGKETGLSVFQYVTALFQANEQLPVKEKMTDAEIERKICAEFPDQPITAGLSSRPRKYTINWYRQRYNDGRFTQGQVPSDGSELPISHRYGINGNRVNARTGNL